MMASQDMRCFVKTQHSWFPSFSLRDEDREEWLVELSLHGKWVAAWGQDDYGLEKTFTSHKEALAAFMGLLAKDYVNPNALIRMGYAQG